MEPAPAPEPPRAESKSKKRKKRRTATLQQQRYYGPHWDEPADAPASASAPVPAWGPEEPEWDTDDADDAVVAPPRPPDAAVLTETVEVPSGRPLTTDEMWDDRFLLDVWNAAEQEYVEFHRRRRASIEAMVQQASDAPWDRLGEVQEPERHAAATAAAAAPRPPANTVLDAAAAGPATAGWHTAKRTVAATPNVIAGQRQDTQAAPAAGGAAPPVPPGLPPSETLQKLVMSWYYTGYYTAMYQRESGTEPH